MGYPAITDNYREDRGALLALQPRVLGKVPAIGGASQPIPEHIAD